MADEVWIAYTELQSVNDQLIAILGELDGVNSKQDALEAAIGRPYDKSRLRNKAHDFEGRWDDKRNKLIEGLGGVQAHVQGVIDGCKAWDEETAASMEVDVTGVNTVGQPL